VTGQFAGGLGGDGRVHHHRRWLASVRVVATFLVLGLAAGSSASAGTGAGAGVASPSAAAVESPGPSLPACADAGAVVSPQADFPASFPLPDGAVVVGADTPPGGGSRIRFLAPIEVPAYGEFLEKELPAAGLSIGGGEAEADELESKFSGDGLDGQVTAREIGGCPGVLSVQVVIRRT